ncbi:unnamed protein product [Prorocentrum cordatum]|uniref:Subtilisin n=1 Tax=Prorocentrum cordatum TaxID=2364126 RepID=A0ABN9XA04_9DINO|nr:unnamed protein product [Polarella glacialis]
MPEAGSLASRVSRQSEHVYETRGRFVAMAVLQDDAICSHIATEAKMASKSNLVEIINVTTDVESTGKPGWGAVDAACGLIVVGIDTYEKWANHYKEQRDITLQTVPRHEKYRFGNDHACAAADGSFTPACWGITSAPFSLAWSRAPFHFSRPRPSSWS